MLVFVWVLLCLGGRFARADDTDRLGLPTNPDAKALLEQGNAHFGVKEFDKAIEFYKQGALIEPGANVFLYNLGHCYRQLGQYEDAIWHYKRFLDRQQPDDVVRMYVEDFIKVMKEKLEQEIKDKPPTEAGGSEQAEPKNDQGDGDLVTGPTDSSKPWYVDTVGWALTGTGAVAALVGGGFLVNAAGIEDDASKEPDQPTRVELQDKASSRRTIGAILTIGGGAVLVAGIVKLVMAPKNAGGNVTGISWTVGTNWIGVRGSF